MAVGLSFGATEQFYNNVAAPATQTLINGTSNYESALQSGWMPQ